MTRLRDLRTYGDQVQAFVVMSDARLITRRLLEDSVRTLKAQSGAVCLQVDGRLEVVHTVGPWRGNPRLSVNLDCDAHHHGVLLLGPPLPDQSYNRQEAEALAAGSKRSGARRLHRAWSRYSDLIEARRDWLVTLSGAS